MLQEKLAEQKYYAEVLELWAHAAAAGYSHEDVRAFTFRPEFLTKEEKVKEARDRRQGVRRYTSLTHHNALRLKDDSIVQIPLVARPTPPDHMWVSINES